MPRKFRRPRSLAGTHLYLRVDTGIYYWRRTDPITGRRYERTTGTKRLDIALRKASILEDEFERKKAGLKTYDGWKRQLTPLAEEWIEYQVGNVAEGTLRTKKVRILRAFEDLDLRIAADLDDVSRLHDRLLAFGRKHKKSLISLRRSYQRPLRQFAKWLAGNNRYLDRNPLLHWEPLKVGKIPPKNPRRAFLPDEMARALIASDALDHIYRRLHPQRLVYTLLLVTAPRGGALVTREVDDFHLRHQVINYGADVGKKRRGAGALDATTATELYDSLDDREEGPLVLSPLGARLQKEKMLDQWREAFSLGLVDELWPRLEPANLDLLHLVNQALLTGKLKVNKGGNPKRLRKETIEKRKTLEAQVKALADELRDTWQERMQGVDVHAFRKTHRTWAEAKGVPPILIDKQLGHTHSTIDHHSMEIMRVIAGSATGRRHYLDLRSTIFDASRSAEAVRQVLDEAENALRQNQNSKLACILACVPRTDPRNQNGRLRNAR